MKILAGFLCLLLFACGEDPGGANTDASDSVADAAIGLDATISEADAALDGAVEADGSIDAAVLDAQTSDGAPLDAQAGDGQPSDAGQNDAESADLGPMDVGFPDGGTLQISPLMPRVAVGGSIVLSTNLPTGAVPTWRIDGQVGSARTGTITPQADPREARYQAPDTLDQTPPATFSVSATIAGEAASVLVEVELVPPTVTGITPNTVAANSPTFVATITGSGFVPDTNVTLGGLLVTVRSVSWNQLSVEIPASLVVFPGERPVEVITPQPGGGTASTSLLVVLQNTTLGPGVPPTVPGLFNSAPIGTDPLELPSITYPEHLSRAPRDFPPPLVSWRHGPRANLCRLRAEAPGAVLDAYVRTDLFTPFQNPQAQIEPSVWSQLFLLGNGANFTLRVACAELAQNGTLGPVHESLPISYSVTNQAAGGRIVYFSGYIEGLWRIDIGGANFTAAPFIGPTPAFEYQTDGCAGCHSLSADGRRLAYSGGMSEFGLLDISTLPPSEITPLTAPAAGEWTGLHPSGRWVASLALDGQLSLRSATTGAVIAPVPTTTVAAFVSQPFWFPLGDRLVFAATNVLGGGVHDVLSGAIWTIDFSATPTTTPSFGRLRQIVAPQNVGENNFYPAFSPDGQWIVFCRAPIGPSTVNQAATLWIVSADGRRGPYPLTAANQAPLLTNSWPRWAPAVSQGRYWIVYSSRRPLPPYNGAGPQQLWIAEVDTNRLPADPSSPGLWLAGQEPFTGNLTAEWTASP